MENAKIYEDRAVLFLDILGFKHLISTNQEGVILEALNVSQEVVNKIVPSKSLMATAFSDCLVASVLTDNGEGVASLINFGSHLWLKYLHKGVLIRGGIAVGKLHHSPRGVFGPAMIEAYQIESEIALFPRIVLSHKSLGTLYQKMYNPEFPRTATAAFLMGYARRDYDGLYHVPTFQHVLLGPEELLPPPSYQNGPTKGWSGTELHEAIAPYVRQAIAEQPKDVRVAPKYDWLERYLTFSEIEAKKGGKNTNEELELYLRRYEQAMVCSDDLP